MSDDAATKVREAKAARARGERLGDREAWLAGKPDRFDARGDLPPFPSECLPRWCGDFAEALATSTQVPCDMTGSFVLGALAAAQAGRTRVRVSPGHEEGTNLYVAVLAEPGTRKSPVHAACGRPLIEAERELREIAAPEVAQAESVRRIAEARLKAAEAAVAQCRKPGEKLALEEDAREAALAFAALPPVALPRLLAGDVTPERLVGLLAELHGRLALYTGEDPIFGHLLGRYSSHPMIDPLLSAYSGDPIRIDRKTGAPITVEDPALTIVLAIQPGVLADVDPRHAIVMRGLRDRFLLVVPPNRIGWRDMDPPPVPDAIQDAYSRRLRAMALAAYRQSEPRVLRLAPDARAAHVAWLRDLELQKRPAGRLASVVGWASKAEGMTARIAGLLHAASGAGTDEIPAECEERAIEIVRYYAAHALVASDVMGADVTRNDARKLLAWAADFGPRFKASDALRAHRTIDASRQRAALGLLEQTRNVRRLPRASTARGGKPSDAWEVHPEAVPSVSSRYPEREPADGDQPSDAYEGRERTEETSAMGAA